MDASNNNVKNNTDISDKGLNSIIKTIKSSISNFELEDLILFGILFILIQEEVKDDFLILIIIFLIFSEKTN